MFYNLINKTERLQAFHFMKTLRYANDLQKSVVEHLTSLLIDM